VKGDAGYRTDLLTDTTTDAVADTLAHAVDLTSAMSVTVSTPLPRVVERLLREQEVMERTVNEEGELRDVRHTYA
jgi:hypothetical protein